VVHAYITRKPRNWPSFPGNPAERAAYALSRLEDISRLVSEIIWEIDTAGTLRFVSERSVEILGIPAQQLIGEKLSELGTFYTDDGLAQEPNWDKPFRGHIFKINDQNGTLRTLSLNGLPHFDKKTWRLQGVYGTAEDITDKLKAENQLRMLSEIIEQNPSMVFVTSLDGTIEYVNAMFRKTTGYSNAEAIGKNPRFLQSGLTPSDTYKDMWATILSGRKWQGEIQNRHKDGTVFWANLTVSPVALSANTINHFVAVHEDITVRKEAEAKLTTAKEEAEIASRAKSEILANTSHELRTPLNAIIGFSSSIQNETFGPLENSAYADYINIIKESGEHLLALINDILDVASLEASQVALHITTFRLMEVMQSSILFVSPRSDHAGIAISCTYDNEDIHLICDERRIKQILLNLLSNAVKFTTNGGEINVTVAREDDGGLAINVTDTGIGMDEADITKAMAQFGQVESDHTRKYHGNGLGLPLTQGLVELHGGTLHIISQKGLGTTVKVYLPPRCVADDTPL